MNKRGFTLIEVLVAVGIAIGTLVLLTTGLPGLAGRGAEQATQTRDRVTSGNLVQAIKEDFTRDTFAGFLDGTPEVARAVFTTGPGVTVPLQDDLATRTTLQLPGLEVPVGGYALLVAAGGQAKLVKVTARSGEQVTTSCAPGLPTNTALRAYPARLLALTAQGGQLLRTDGERTEVITDRAQNLAFHYVYTGPGGALVRDPGGAPASRVPAGTLSGLLPTAVTAANLDTATLVPLEPGIVSSFLACETIAVPTGRGARLTVSIEGVPGGAVPDVLVQGPDPDVNGARPTTSRTYVGVQRGAYTLAAQNLTHDGFLYQATVSGSPAQVRTDWGQSFMSARYAAVDGKLSIDVSGLGAEPSRFTLTGPGGPRTFSAGNGNVTVTGLIAGTYTLAADTVTTSTATYSAPAQTVTLPAGQTVQVPVAFTRVATAGQINTTVSGLPGGAAVTVRYAGPATGSVAAGNGQVLFENLPAGTYTISGDPASAGGSTYVAPSETVTVTAGGRAEASLGYSASGTASPAPSASVGTIELTIGGFPGEFTGTGAIAFLNGPKPASVGISNSVVTFSNFPVGTYWIALPTVNFSSEGDRFTLYPNPAGATFTVVGGQTTRVAFTYGGARAPTYTPPGSGGPSTGGPGSPPATPPGEGSCTYGALRCIEGTSIGGDIVIGGVRYPAGTSLEATISTPRGTMTLNQFLENNNPDQGDMQAVLRPTSWAPNPSADPRAARGEDVPPLGGGGGGGGGG